MPASDGLEQGLRELSVVASALNEETDRLNERIVSIEERLNSMGVGATYWLDQHEHHLSVGPWVETQVGGDDCRSREAWAVGYTKISSKWCLAAQEVEFQERGSKASKSFRLGKPITLLSAPRIVRVEAVEKMGALIAGLTETTKDFLSSIRG